MLLSSNGLVKPAPWAHTIEKTSHLAQDLWQDCVLAMPFWGSGGRVVEDVSGYGLHGTIDSGLNGTSAWVATPYGTGIHVDTAIGASRIYVPDPSTDLLDGVSKLSAEILFRPTGVTGTQGLLGKYTTSAGQRSWRLYLTGDEVELQVSTDGTGNETKATTATNLTAGNWYHVVVTFDAGTFKVYVDGKSQAVAGNFTATSIFNGTRDFEIGARSDSNDLTGEIVGCRVWRRALRAEEALFLWERPWAMYEAVSWLPSYAVLHSGGAAAGAWQLVDANVPKGAQVYQIPGLMNGTSYDVKLESVDTAGNVSAGTTLVAGTPAATGRRSPAISRVRVQPPPLVDLVKAKMR